MKLDQSTLYDARHALMELKRRWIYDPNVSLIDFGWPEENGELLKDELALRVHVRQKYDQGPMLEMAIREGETLAQIPDTFEGFRVDVPQGKYKTQWWRPARDPRACHCDPLKGGYSLSNVNQNIYGTLGGMVTDRSSGAQMVLSNWHILVGSWWAAIGQSICQPGIGDGGRQADIVASLSRDAMSAYLDAAVAEVTGNRRLINEQFGLGPVAGVEWAQIGTEVVKSGRRTGVTYGVVTAIEGTAKLPYSGRNRIIQNVMTIEPRLQGDVVSDSGDSGSLWLRESTMTVVGLHFAGGNDPERALAMDIQPVLDALNVNIAV